MSTSDAMPFQLRFRSLFGHGPDFAFPCDAEGRVDLDHLSERALQNYLRARALVGRELALPTVEETDRSQRRAPGR